MKVTKRDGTLAEFDKNKIVNAISAAFKECGYEDASKVINEITDEVQTWDEINIEDIQDQVEELLMDYDFPDVAKAYILYREERKMLRAEKDKLIKGIKSKLEASNVKNQNANIDEHSFGGRIGEAGRVVTKDYALNYCMSEMAKHNHENNEIYIHDLDSYAVGMHNCYSHDTKFVTSRGVRTFDSFTDGQPVEILNKNGDWEFATVHQYEKQKMYTLEFSAGITKKTVTCTRNHRWILSNGDITDNIQVGDKLMLTPTATNDFTVDNTLWCFGFVLGDGCDYFMYSKDKSRITNSGMNVRLCSDKVEYLDNFLKAGYSIRQHHSNGDITLHTRGNGSYKQNFLESKFWNLLDKNAIASIFLGYFSADGCKANNTISTTDGRLAEFIEFAAPLAGFHVWSKREHVKSTNYKEDVTYYDFQLCVKQQENKPWRLDKITAGSVQVTWCVEAPETHSFTLAGCMVTGNCLSIPVDDLLANGFKLKQTDVRPAKSVNTAFQLLAVIFQVQSLQQFGGVSATHLDWTMVPYVRLSFNKHYRTGLKYIDHLRNEKYNQTDLSIEDSLYKEHPNSYEYALDMTKREIHQAVEGMYHNLNTLQSRSGNQLPFTSINYGTCTQPEGRLISLALLEVSKNGIGSHHSTPIFPCCIVQLMKGVNRKPGDPNYDIFQEATKVTSLRLYPNYANVDWSGNEGYDINDPRTYFSTMGCRTANGWDINGFGQLKDGRGNICPVTIILPTLAMNSKLQAISNMDNADIDTKDLVWDKFIELLDTKIHEAKDMLIERFDWICSQDAASAKFMYQNNVMYGYKPEEGIRSALKHGTLAIGQLGLSEALRIIFGKDHTDSEIMDKAKELEGLFKKRCSEFKEAYKLNFGVYYTPAENLCYTAMQKFKKQFGEVPGITEREFFTNSMHVPVWHECTPFEKIEIESQLTGFSSAGCITYVELPASTKHNPEAIEEIVNYAMDHDIPYFAINVPNDSCQDCGYTDELNDTCPMCGSKNIKRLRRVTGYN